MNDDTKRLFFVAPIGPDGSTTRRRSDAILEKLREACEPLGIQVARADEDPRPGTITTAIVRAIVEADAVAADITGGNANVFYELGIADAFLKPVILITDRHDTTPFDVRQQRAITLSSIDYQDVQEFARLVEPVLTAAMAHPEADNPVAMVSTQAALRQLDDPEATSIQAILRHMEELRQDVSTVLRAVSGGQVSEPSAATWGGAQWGQGTWGGGRRSRVDQNAASDEGDAAIEAILAELREMGIGQTESVDSTVSLEAILTDLRERGIGRQPESP